MRRFPLYLAGVILACSVTHLQARAAYGTQAMGQAGTDLTSTLQGYETEINQALKNKDISAFNAHVDPNALSVDETGFTPTSQFATMIKDLECSSFTIENYQVHMIDKDAAVATYVWRGTVTFKGQAGPPVTYCCTVWARQGKDWKAIYHQESAAAGGMSGMGGMNGMKGMEGMDGMKPSGSH